MSQSEKNLLTHPFEFRMKQPTVLTFISVMILIFCVYIRTYTSIYTHTGIYECVCIYIYTYTATAYIAAFLGITSGSPLYSAVLAFFFLCMNSLAFSTF